ncbi:T9SS type A sorting domain-containing protein [Xanthomarina sp. GH4-25]|uniref:T9SS type A sorting domain-containing protein n=1 Tax=Xanthomarina sp. GH4-25 TaxID=3349335 RepID=UPI0038780B92
MKLTLLLILCPFFLFSQVQIGEDIDGIGHSSLSGSAVSLSSDGSVVAIGAPYSNSSKGLVRIYENVSGVWTQVGSSISGEAFNDYSGESVSLSSDGSIVAIGAPYNNGNGDRSGHVRVYENVSGVWMQVGQDIDGEATEDLSGSAVSLSLDGSVIAIGAPLNNGNGDRSGHVRVYKNVSGVWTQVGWDINGEVDDDVSGIAVSLSSDGSVVAIGAGSNDNGFDSGHVRIYKNISGVWTQIGSDIDGEATRDHSGRAVCLSSDGSIVAIGAPENDGNGDRENCGHVRMFEYVSGAWTQVGNDIDGGSTNGKSGSSVSLSSDGSIVAIGAPLNNGNGRDSGYVRIYKNVSGVWTQEGSTMYGEAEGDHSGSAISLSSDGSVVAIGAPRNNNNYPRSGHVRVYDTTESLTIEENNVTVFNIYPNPAQNQVTIQLQEGLELNQVNIYNTLGQFISTSKEKVINTSHLSSGLYLLEIETTQGKATKQLIIE